MQQNCAKRNMIDCTCNKCKRIPAGYLFFTVANAQDTLTTPRCSEIRKLATIQHSQVNPMDRQTQIHTNSTMLKGSMNSYRPSERIPPPRYNINENPLKKPKDWPPKNRNLLMWSFQYVSYGMVIN